MSDDSEAPERTISSTLDSWGTSALPASILATLLVPLHTHPIQPFPLLFVPVLLFGSYVNLAGYPTDAAAHTAAFSGLYALLALRRRQPIRSKLSIRGAVRGTAIGLGAMNCVAGLRVAVKGDRKVDREVREERGRWD